MSGKLFGSLFPLGEIYKRIPGLRWQTTPSRSEFIAILVIAGSFTWVGGAVGAIFVGLLALAWLTLPVIVTVALAQFALFTLITDPTSVQMLFGEVGLATLLITAYSHESYLLLDVAVLTIIIGVYGGLTAIVISRFGLFEAVLSIFCIFIGSSYLFHRYLLLEIGEMSLDS